MLCWHSHTPSLPENNKYEMNTTKHLFKSSNPMVLSTYQKDFVPFSPHLLRANMKTRPEPLPPTGPTPPRVPWPIFSNHFYKGSNSAYGSFPPPLLSVDYSTPASTMGAVTPVTLQQVSAETLKTGPMLGVGARGQLQYVFGGQGHMHKGGVKTDGLVEEGVLVISSDMGMACCENFLPSVYREAGLEHLLNIPLPPAPVTCSEWANCPYWQPFRQALRSSATQYPRCTCFHQKEDKENCGWSSPDSCFQVIPSPSLPPLLPPPPPHLSVLPMVQVYQTVCRALNPQPIHKPLLPLYLNNYTTEWARP